MRATLVTLGLAALALASVGACTDQSRLLSPDAQVSKALVPPSGDRCLIMRCPPPPPNFIDISAGSGVSCAVHSSNLQQQLLGVSNLWCWGDNSLGMLGVGFGATTERCPGPVPIAPGTIPPNIIPCSTLPVNVAGGRSFSSVSVGVDHVCAVESGSAAAFCWGSNGYGQLGFMGASSGTPTAPVAGFAFNSVAAGSGVSCGITTAQALVCWGAGYGATPVEPTPGAQYASVSVEQTYVCGLSAGGQPCAGTRYPYSVVGQANTARHICQIFGGGQTECYGDNSRGQLGLSTRTLSLPDYKPNVIMNFSFQSVATGYDHTCALSGTDAFCWGGNFYGQLGGPTSYPAGTPGQVQAASGTTLSFVKISTGDQHTCAIANNAVFCWGRDDLGQLGIGSLNLWAPGNNAIASVTPLKVVGI